ncbi:isopentenyl transferase family protein [Streptomyces wedmorensis]
MHVLLLLGATGTGKTARATALAQERGYPVIVADRIQCFTDLPLISGRLPADPQDGIERFYPAARTVPDGDYPAPEACVSTLRILDRLATTHDGCVVEGGSMSLVSRLVTELHRRRTELTVAMTPVPDHYDERSRRRIQRVLQPAPRTILTELRQAWRHTEQRDFIKSILGFDALVAWCESRRISPLELPAALTASDIEDITTLLVGRAIAHARAQVKTFGALAIPAGGIDA